MNVEEIQQELRNLSKDEVEQIKVQCEYLLSRVKTKNTETVQPAPEYATNLYGIIRRMAFRYNIHHFPTFPMLQDRQPKLYKRYLEQAERVEEFVNATFKDEDQKDLSYVKRVLIKIYIKELLEQFGRDLNYSIVINNMHRMPQIFEKQFPGYIKNGLQRMIIRGSKDA